MKIFIAFAALLVAGVALTSAKPHHEPPAHVKAAIDTCMQQQNVTKEQLHERKKDREDQTEDCFDACVDKALGVIASDGSIDKEVAAKNFPPHVSEEDAKKIVDACFEKKGANDCETTVLYRKCVKELIPRPPLSPEMQKAHDSCKEKLSLTDEDIEKLHKARDEAKEDCFLDCLGRSTGMITEDGNLSESKLLEKLPPHLTEEDAKKIVAECGSTKGANDCETAILVHKCFKKNHFRPGGHHGAPPSKSE